MRTFRLVVVSPGLRHGMAPRGLQSWTAIISVLVLVVGLSYSSTGVAEGAAVPRPATTGSAATGTTGLFVPTEGGLLNALAAVGTATSGHLATPIAVTMGSILAVEASC